MKKVVLSYGLIAGLIVTTLMLGSMSLKHDKSNFEMAEVIGYATMIVSLSMVFFGIKSYRNNYLNGFISFGKAFQVGLYITLIASAMYVAGWMIYSETAGSNFMDEYYELSISEVKASNKPAPEIAAEIKKIDEFREMYKNPIVKIGFTFIEIFPVGLLISVLAAFILKRKPTSQQEVPFHRSGKSKKEALNH